MTFNVVQTGFGCGMSTSQSPSWAFLDPVMICLPFLKTFMCFLSNSTLQLSSHNFPTESNDALFKSVKNCAFFAGEDNSSIGRYPLSCDLIVFKSGRVTLGPELG